MWKSLDPKQRMMITIGVPLVAVAAIYTAMKQKKAPAAAQVVVSGAPEFGNGASDSFGLYRDLTAYLENLPGQQNPAQPTPTPDIPHVDSMGNSELLAKANTAYAAGQNIQPYQAELIKRVTVTKTLSVNDPSWSGPDGKPLGIWYATAPLILGWIQSQGGHF